LGGQYRCCNYPKGESKLFTNASCLFRGHHRPFVQWRTLACRTGRRSTNLYFFHREIAMLASTQKRGSDEAHDEIIRGLKPFHMAIRPRGKDAIMRNG